MRHDRAPSATCVLQRQHHTCQTCGRVCESAAVLAQHVATVHTVPSIPELQRRIETLETLLAESHQREEQSAHLASTHWQTLTRERDTHELTVKHHKSLMDTVQYNHARACADSDRRYASLEKTVDALRREPRTQVTHTTQIQNMQVNNNFAGALNLDPRHIERVVDTTFNMDALMGGTESLARYAMNQLLTGDDGAVLYTASDTARHVFKYKDAVTGEVIRDPKAAMLLRSLMPPVYRQVRALCPLNDSVWYDAEKMRDYNGLRVLEASYDQVMAVSPSAPNAFCKALVREMVTKRRLLQSVTAQPAITTDEQPN